MLPASLTRHLKAGLLNEKAGPDVFWQGRRLAARGSAEITGFSAFVIHASVSERCGRRFDLWFRATRDGLECKCICRLTVRGACCKHVVAAALTALRLEQG